MRKWMLLSALLCLQGAVAAAELPVNDHHIVRKTSRIEVDVAYPTTGNAAIDGVLSPWAKRSAADFQGDDLEDADTRAPWTLDIGYTVARNDASVFAVQFAISDYSGGAHGNHGFASFNFLMPEGVPVDLEQVLVGEKGLQRLSQLVIADLKKQLLPEDASTAQWIEEGAGPSWNNFRDFLLLKDALHIDFAPYAVAPYSSGPQEVVIPLSALQGVLRSNLRTPIPSFACERAGTDIEHAICASLTLARFDRRVADVYRERLRIGGSDNQPELKQAQRAWIAERNRSCGSLQGAALEQCLMQVYRARLRALEAI